jgi:hypothetical protein
MSGYTNIYLCFDAFVRLNLGKKPVSSRSTSLAAISRIVAQLSRIFAGKIQVKEAFFHHFLFPGNPV